MGQGPETGYREGDIAVAFSNTPPWAANPIDTAQRRQFDQEENEHKIFLMEQMESARAEALANTATAVGQAFGAGLATHMPSMLQPSTRLASGDALHVDQFCGSGTTEMNGKCVADLEFVCAQPGLTHDEERCKINFSSKDRVFDSRRKEVDLQKYAEKYKNLPQNIGFVCAAGDGAGG